MNSQGSVFDEKYEEVLASLTHFVEASSNGSMSEADIRDILGLFGDVYTEAYLREIEYVLDMLGLEFNETERTVIRNKVGTSKFVRDNYKRITEILSNRAEEIKELTKEIEDKEVLKSRLSNIATLIALAELQMTVEHASVFGSAVIQDILGVRLTKTWNATLDENTCEICSAMHGTTIGVEESFINTRVGSEYSEYLSYAGGEGAYAHPRCRCWLTYQRA